MVDQKKSILTYFIILTLISSSCNYSKPIDPFNHLEFQLDMSKEDFILNSKEQNYHLNDSSCVNEQQYTYYDKILENVVIFCGDNNKIAGYLIDNKIAMIWITYYTENEILSKLYEQKNAEIQNYQNAKSFFKENRKIESVIQIIDNTPELVLINHELMIADSK